MSELQIGLVAIGVVLILAVWIYNRWQDAKYRKLANERFASDHADALLEPGARRQATPSAEDLEGDIPPMSQDAAQASMRASESAGEFESSSAGSESARTEPARIEPTFGEELEEDVEPDSQPSEFRTASPSGDESEELMAESAASAVIGAASDRATPAAAAQATAKFTAAFAAQPAVSGAASLGTASAGSTDAPPAVGAEEGVRIDFVARFSGAVDADQLLGLMEELRQGFRKAVWVNGWSEANARWTALAPGLRCNAVSMGLQLVDRNGPLRADEIARFHAAAEALAEHTGLSAELPDTASAAGDARALDQFCADVDIQIVLNLVATANPFAGTKIRALAESAGFALEKDGFFRLRNDAGVAMFALSNQASSQEAEGAPGFEAARMRELSTPGIAFQYDLPRVPGGVRSFDHFCEIARNFANVLGGRLVDDNRVEIGQQALRAIRTQVQSVHAAMDARGLPAGSPVALRLFS